MDRNDPTDLWNAKAEDWHVQVGHEGDLNRRLNSDSVLRSFLDDVDEVRLHRSRMRPGSVAFRLEKRANR